MQLIRSVSHHTLGSIFETLRIAVALAIAVLALAASASALPPGWSHAQVNVVIKHVGHTLIYDRGTVTRVAKASLTLRENDTSIVVIRVAPSAVVTLNGKVVSLDRLHAGEFAQTMRLDGNPATEVRARKVAPTA